MRWFKSAKSCLVRDFRALFAALAGLLLSACANGESIERFLLSLEPVEISSATIENSEAESEISADASWRRLTLVRRSGEGDAQAAYALYRMSLTVGEERKWICVAASLGLAKAQAEMARMHWRRPPPRNYYSPFPRDIVKAYVWARIATRNGESLQSMARHLTVGMSAAERLLAERLVKEWKPDPAACE